MASNPDRRGVVLKSRTIEARVHLIAALLLLAAVTTMSAVAIESSEQLAQTGASSPIVTNLASRIAALADNRFVSADGQALRRGDVARMEIIRVGEAALPQLKAALQDQGPLVRAKLLSIVALLGIRMEEPLNVVPTLSSALSDKEMLVRQSAVGALGEICMYLHRKDRQQILDEVSLHLAGALKDKTSEVRMPAAMFLIKCGKSKLVPKSLRKAVEQVEGIELPPAPNESEAPRPAPTASEE